MSKESDLPFELPFEFRIMSWEEARPVGIELIEFFKSRQVSGINQCLIMAHVIAANIRVLTHGDYRNGKSAAKNIGKMILDHVTTSSPQWLP